MSAKIHSYSARASTKCGCLALDSEMMSPQHFNNFTGCQYNIVSPSNFVYSCTKYTKRAPSYLTDKVTATADLQSCAGLRSASTSNYQTPRTCMSTDGQGTLWHRSIARNFNRLSRAHERYKQTDRQTYRQTDG